MSHLPIDPTASNAVHVRGDFQFDAPPPDSEDSDDKTETNKEKNEKSSPTDQKRSWMKRLTGRAISTTATDTATATSEEEVEAVKPPFALRGINIGIPRGEILTEGPAHWPRLTWNRGFGLHRWQGRCWEDCTTPGHDQ